MRLARADNAAEDQWLAGTPVFADPNYRRECMWLGGSDLAAEGDWRWEDGEAFWSGAAAGTPLGGLYTNWQSGDPNNLNGVEHCLCTDLGNNPTWIDADCSLLRYYACETY